MTTRTFKQFGQGYGATPATVTAIIGGTTVFSGNVPTVDSPMPSLPDLEVTGTELYSWTNTVDFAGTQSFSLSVQNSTVLLMYSFADYYVANNSAEFGPCYSYALGNILICDPFTDVAIDGISLQRGTDENQLSGQWYWTIPAGSTFTATLNVSAGVEPSPPTP